MRIKTHNINNLNELDIWEKCALMYTLYAKCLQQLEKRDKKTSCFKHLNASLITMFT